MPYTLNNPPAIIKNLPKKAKEIWIKAFNNALKTYNNDEEIARRVAWSAVKKAGYKKGKDGKWRKEGDAVKTENGLVIEDGEINVIDSVFYELPRLDDGKLKNFKDALGDADSNNGIIIVIDASHIGFVNKNGYFYTPESVRSAVSSWTTPYPKPILRNHDEYSDPIGRVVMSEYVEPFVPLTGDTSDTDPLFVPKGVIRLNARILDKASINKILDGRYLTVSTRQKATSVVCSICNQKIEGIDSMCEHERMKVYDKKLCFWYVDIKEYVECSFVNRPADEYGQVVRIEGQGLYSGDKKDNIVIPNEYVRIIGCVGDELMDLQADGARVSPLDSIGVEEFKSLLVSDKDGNEWLSANDVYLSKLKDEGFFDGLDVPMSDVSNEMFCGLGRTLPVVNPEQGRLLLDTLGDMSLSSTQKRDVRENLYALFYKQGWDFHTAYTSVTKGGKQKPMDYKDNDIYVCPIDGEDEYTSDFPEDKKLTYAERKRLPDSAFCLIQKVDGKVRRRFPAHDAAHVRNGLARLPQAKDLSPAERKKVYNCLVRRAKKYGIKVSPKKGDADDLPEKIEVIDIKLCEATLDDILALEIVQDYIRQLEDKYAQEKRDAVSQAIDELDNPEAVSIKDMKQGYEDALKELSKAKENLQKEVNALKDSIREKDKDIEAIRSENKTMATRLHRNLAERIVDIRVLLKKPDTSEILNAASSDLKAEARKKLVESFAARRTDSLEDTLRDLSLELGNISSDISDDNDDVAGDDPIVGDDDIKSGKKEELTEDEVVALVARLLSGRRS